MNRIEIIGHIGRDAEVKEFGEKVVINFNVAVTEKRKDQQGNEQSETYWYKCARWANNANLANYLTKGTQVLVSGKPKGASYVDKQGELQQMVGITVQSLKFLGGGNGQPKQNNQQQQQASAQNYSGTYDPNAGDDTLPF